MRKKIIGILKSNNVLNFKTEKDFIESEQVCQKRSIIMRSILTIPIGLFIVDLISPVILDNLISFSKLGGKQSFEKNKKAVIEKLVTSYLKNYLDLYFDKFREKNKNSLQKFFVYAKNLLEQSQEQALSTKIFIQENLKKLQENINQITEFKEKIEFKFEMFKILNIKIIEN